MTELASRTKQSSVGRTFSFEIHGVRGLALTMVVAFHLFGGGRVSGGVDVFLVISSYLMAGSLLRSIESGHLSLPYRYGRTFSRLQPAALVTIVATLLAGLVIFPRSRWLGLFNEAGASATFTENIYLATTGLSYEAAGLGASPFQHFWSLSMQGQFLLLWPLLAFLIIYLLRSASSPRKKALFLSVTGVVTVLSFIYAIHLVSVDQPVAYYSLGARLWEFGLGALAASLTSGARKYPGVGGWLGWAGVAMILSSGVVADGGSTFPGPWALWPVMGTLLFLFGVDSGGTRRTGLERALSAKPIIWLANRGYPLYLWHWPILVFLLSYQGKEQVSYAGATAVLAGSLLLSEVTTRFVSAPFSSWANRTQQTSRGRWVVLSVLIVLTLGTAASAHAGALREEVRVEAMLTEAQSLAQSPELPPSRGLALPPPEEPYAPAFDVAEKDIPNIFDLGCVQKWRDGLGLEEVLTCPDNPGPNAKTVDEPFKVVMSGGSHVVQFYSPFRQIADEEGWELIVIDKSGCRLAVDEPDSSRRQSCIEWNKNALDVIIGEEPDLVVTLGTVTHSTKPEQLDQTQVAAWTVLTDAGIPVLTMRDTPRFPEAVPECLEQAKDVLDCGVQTSDAYTGTSPLRTGGPLPLVTELDLSERMCDEEMCPPIIGNIVAYRDTSHITDTFARHLTPYVREDLKSFYPHLFSER